MKRTALKRKSRLKPVSKKHSARLREYMKLRQVFLVENPVCEVTARLKDEAVPATEVHHMKGRGRYLLDTSTWLPVSREGHQLIHNNPKWARARGYILSR